MSEHLRTQSYRRHRYLIGLTFKLFLLENVFLQHLHLDPFLFLVCQLVSEELFGASPPVHYHFGVLFIGAPLVWGYIRVKGAVLFDLNFLLVARFIHGVSLLGNHFMLLVESFMDSGGRVGVLAAAILICRTDLLCISLHNLFCWLTSRAWLGWKEGCRRWWSFRLKGSVTCR